MPAGDGPGWRGAPQNGLTFPLAFCEPLGALSAILPLLSLSPGGEEASADPTETARGGREADGRATDGAAPARAGPVSVPSPRWRGGSRPGSAGPGSFGRSGSLWRVSVSFQGLLLSHEQKTTQMKSLSNPNLPSNQLRYGRQRPAASAGVHGRPIHLGGRSLAARRHGPYEAAAAFPPARGHTVPGRSLYARGRMQTQSTDWRRRSPSEWRGPYSSPGAIFNRQMFSYRTLAGGCGEQLRLSTDQPLDCGRCGMTRAAGARLAGWAVCMSCGECGAEMLGVLLVHTKGPKCVLDRKASPRIRPDQTDSVVLSFRVLCLGHSAQLSSSTHLCPGYCVVCGHTIWRGEKERSSPQRRKT